MSRERTYYHWPDGQLRDEPPYRCGAVRVGDGMQCVKLSDHYGDHELPAPTPESGMPANCSTIPNSSTVKPPLMVDGRTHYEGCWTDHHDCALARIETLKAQLAAIQSWRLSANLTPGQDAALTALADTPSRTGDPES